VGVRAGVAGETGSALLEAGDYDDVLIATLSKGRSEWLRRDLPRRIGRLGVSVEVISRPADTGPLQGVVAGPV
jgi:hypothetical protein